MSPCVVTRSSAQGILDRIERLSNTPAEAHAFDVPLVIVLELLRVIVRDDGSLASAQRRSRNEARRARSASVCVSCPRNESSHVTSS